MSSIDYIHNALSSQMVEGTASTLSSQWIFGWFLGMIWIWVCQST